MNRDVNYENNIWPDSKFDDASAEEILIQFFML